MQPGKEGFWEVFFCPDGIEKFEDSTRIRMGGQISTGGLPGCRFGSRND